MFSKENTGKKKGETEAKDEILNISNKFSLDDVLKVSIQSSKKPNPPKT